MNAQGFLKMADLTHASGVSDQAVRLYERKGLLSPVSRTPKGYRLFDLHAVEAIRFIKQAQRCGFTLTEIRELLNANVVNLQACAATQALLDQKLERVEGQLADLKALRKVLISLRRACDGESGAACPAFIRLCAPGTPESLSKKEPK